ncbi:MAG: type II secretion system protein [Rhodopirellula sp.]|nr:type II secretion system protein [Rhodopirellula sp.]
MSEATEQKQTEASNLSAASSFTPIEWLMALTLLSIVLATVVPQMLSAGEEANQIALLQRLHLVRRQIDLYRESHNGQLPAAGRNSTGDFQRDLASVADRVSESKSGDGSGLPIETEFPPVNPYTQQSEILVIPDPLEDHHYSGTGRHGWVYSSATGEFRSNLSPQITDRSGRLINQL